MNWTLSPYIVILHYRPYSCGKFLSNVLSFNQNFIPQMALTKHVKRYNSIIEQVNAVEVFDSSIENLILEYKIEQIFTTIPESIDQCQQWREYELGCRMFWNFNAPSLKNIDQVHAVCLRLLENKKYCFIVSHDSHYLNILKQQFPNSKVIELINDDKINQMSSKLKLSFLNSLPTQNIESTLTVDAMQFDIGTMFDSTQFFTEIEKLLRKFEIDDISLDNRVYNYYNQYTNLYQGLL